MIGGDPEGMQQRRRISILVISRRSRRGGRGDLDRRALTIVNRWDDKGTQPCPAWRAREEGELEEGGARERYIDHQEESSSLLGRGKRSGK